MSNVRTGDAHLRAKPAAFASLAAMKEGVKGFFTGRSRNVSHKTTTAATGPGTTVVSKDTLYAPEAKYRNPCLDCMTLTFPPLAALLALTALACAIGGYAKYSNSAEDFIDPSDRDFHAVWIINIILTPIPLLLALVTCLLSCLARHHESRSYKDPITDHPTKRHKWAFLAAPLLSFLLLSLLLLSAYFLFSTLVAHRRQSEIDASLDTRAGISCVIDDVVITDPDECDDLETGYDVLLFGGLFGFLSTLPLLLLGTAALAHAMSYKKYHEKNTHLHDRSQVVRQSTA